MEQQQQQQVNPVEMANQMFANITKMTAQMCSFIEQLAIQIDQLQKLIPVEKKFIEHDSRN